MTFSVVLLVAAASIAAPGAPSVTVLPFGKDVPARALFDAVEGALPTACRARGLSAVRVDKVKPVKEAIARCPDDACRVAQAKRLGARWVLLGKTTPEGLWLRIVEVEGGLERGARTSTGTPPQVLAAAGALAEELVEVVSPRAAHERALAIERARKARATGDREGADAAYAAALGADVLDENAADLWLARARMWDESGDRERSFKTWDALAAALGPAPAKGSGVEQGVDAGTVAPAAGIGTDPAGPLDAATRQRVADALLDHLRARATFQLDVADEDQGPDKPALLEVAAGTHLTIARLFPAVRGEALFSAAEILRDAGKKVEAGKLYDEVLAEPTASDEIKVRAAARKRL